MNYFRTVWSLQKNKQNVQSSHIPPQLSPCMYYYKQKFVISSEVFCCFWQINLNLGSYHHGKNALKITLMRTTPWTGQWFSDGTMWNNLGWSQRNCIFNITPGWLWCTGWELLGQKFSFLSRKLSWKCFPHHLHIEIWCLTLQFKPKQNVVFIFKYCLRCQHRKNY